MFKIIKYKARCYVIRCLFALKKKTVTEGNYILEHEIND